jgi:hypothetical protein
MMKKINRRKLMLGIGALVGVPLLFSIYVDLSYRLALRAGRLPITNEPEWVWWSLLALLLAFGIYLFSLVTNGKTRMVLAALYLVAMTAALLWIHLTVACMHGDCL